MQICVNWRQPSDAAEDVEGLLELRQRDGCRERAGAAAASRQVALLYLGKRSATVILKP